jgi:hypothetical protein
VFLLWNRQNGVLTGGIVACLFVTCSFNSPNLKSRICEVFFLFEPLGVLLANVALELDNPDLAREHARGALAHHKSPFKAMHARWAVASALSRSAYT